MTIIFDLGNVILDFDPYILARKLEPLCGRTPRQILDVVWYDGWELRFTGGLIDGAQLTAGLNEALEMNLTEQELRVIWEDIFTENTETSALIRQLKPHYQLILLSNTNSWHWEFGYEKFAIVREFDKTVLSFKERCVKPEARIYQIAMALADGDSKMVFFDDMQANVDGAIAVGLDAVRFESAAQVSAELRRRGCEW